MQRELRKLQNLGGIGYALPYCMCGTFKMINEIGEIGRGMVRSTNFSVHSCVCKRGIRFIDVKHVYFIFT